MPSWQLVGAVFGVDILASLFVLFGWVSKTGGFRSVRCADFTAIFLTGVILKLSGSGYPEPEFRSG